MMQKTNVFLTVDVECSIGGAFADPALKPVGSDKRIFGRFKDREYGIPLIMDIADRYQIPLVFFIETFHQYFFDSSDTRNVIEAILKRGHDIQLHLHPGFRNFSLPNPHSNQLSDLCANYSLDQQTEIIADARDRLVVSGAPAPLAFRAGCFGANLDTLMALKNNAFMIDSSYNQSYLNKTCLFPDLEINDLSVCSGIFEFPINQFQEQTGLRHPRTMPLDINGVSFEEIRHVLNASQGESAPRNITVLLHSFSFIKPYDVQYAKMRPRWNVIRRFENLCKFLAQNSSFFHVRTFNELTRDALNGMVNNACNMIPEMPAHLSLKRFAGQLYDRLI